jgi:hypothetical protein
MNKIICTCSSCVVKTCTDEEGNSNPGQFVSRKTQLQHHRDELEASQGHLSTNQGTSLKQETINNHQPETIDLQDLLKKQEGLDYEALHAGGCDTSLTGK